MQTNLRRPHIAFAHRHWESLVRPGDLVIDATCGNGYDTLKLATLALTKTSGQVFAFDIQKQAIESASKLLDQTLETRLFQRVRFVLGCHSCFLPEIKEETVKLVVYNLGYLPKGDKSITTHTNTSLASIKKALNLVSQGGAISIMCYPGHPEGFYETEKCLEFAKTLDVKIWNCSHHQWINKEKAPSLLILHKKAGA